MLPSPAQTVTLTGAADAGRIVSRTSQNTWLRNAWYIQPFATYTPGFFGEILQPQTSADDVFEIDPAIVRKLGLVGQEI